jgi:hypothetical protein
MYPPVKMLPMVAGHALAAYLGLELLGGGEAEPLGLTPRALGATVAAVLMMLVLRLYDDLKDAEHDRRLAAEGDRRYTERPLVTGEVREDDLRVGVVAVWLVLAALHLFLGLWVLSLYVLSFLLIWLSSRWFFWPAVAKNLLLALITHLPVYLVAFDLYMAAVYQQDVGWALPPRALSYLVGLWLSWAVWETARKVRLPEEETGFQTYSKMLGWRRAVVQPVLFVGASAGLLLVALVPALGEDRWAAVGLLGGVAALLAGVCLALLTGGTRRISLLPVVAQLYVLAAAVGLPLLLVLLRGVAWWAPGWHLGWPQ